MKKFSIVVFLLSLLLFSGCNSDTKAYETAIPEFNNENNLIEVQKMSFDETGNIIFEIIGYADESGLHLYNKILQDEYLYRNDIYNYEGIIKYEDFINSDGIIIYRNNVFAIFKNSETAKLILISDRSYRAYGTEYEFTEFIASAVDFYKGAYSGGDGLM